MRNMNKKQQRGFSIIEIMFGIAIAATAAAFLVPNLLNSRNDSRINFAKTEINGRLLNLADTMKTRNGGVGCTGLTTAQLTAANGAQAYANAFQNAVTVTAATVNDVTFQFPTPGATEAAAVNSGLANGSFTHVVAGVNINVTYPCL